MNAPSIDVGIPAYNEEDTIVTVLEFLYRQKEVRINKTIVVNDGSTDATLGRIYSLDENIKQKLNIKVINLEKNLGKANALNIIFKEADQEYLVLLDADVVPVSTNTLRMLIEPLLRSPNVGLVCGWYETLSRGPFDVIGNAFKFSSYLLENIATKLNNVYGATGAIMALRKECYKDLIIPSDIIRDDAYIYFFVKYIKRRKFIFNPRARVRPLRLDYTISRFIHGQARTRTLPPKLIHVFGDVVIREHKVSLDVGVKSLICAFFKNPLGFFS